MNNPFETVKHTDQVMKVSGIEVGRFHLKNGVDEDAMRIAYEQWWRHTCHYNLAGAASIW